MTSHGINAGDVKKLQDAGIYTCNGLMMHTKKVKVLFPLLKLVTVHYLILKLEFCCYFQNLTGIKGLSEAKVDKICEAAEKIVVRISFPDCQNCQIPHHAFIFHFLHVLNSLFCYSFQNFGYITGSDALLKVSPVFPFKPKFSGLAILHEIGLLD